MTDLMEALREQGITKKGGFHAGDNYTTCPNCSPHRKAANRNKPCLSVKLDDRGGAVWNCHHCGWNGNVPGARDGTPYPDRQERRPVKAAKQPPSKPVRPPGLLKWFAARGIGEDTIDELGIYVGKQWFPQIEAEDRAIIFPYRSGGKVVNNKYRSKDKHFRQDKDAEKVLYNIDSVVDDDVVMFVEGEMDVAACMEAGYRQVVSLPEGAPPPNAKLDDPHAHDRRFEALANCWERIEPIKRYIIAGDSDEAGQRLRAEYARRLGKEKCWKVTWPGDCKDAGDCLQQHGAARLQACVDNAIGWPIAGLFQIEPGTLRRLRDTEPERLFSTGWESIDELFKIPLGHLMVVTGIPSHGKSEFIDALAINTARNYGWSWALCSPENPMADHAGKLVEKFLDKPMYQYEPGLEVATNSELGVGEAWLNRHFTFIRQDGDNPLNLDFVLDRAHVAVMRHGVRGVVVDPYNEIEHYLPRNTNESQYQSGFLARCRKFAARHDVLFVIIAHPTKLGKNSDGSSPVPGMYDISGSAHWKNKADIGLTVYKPGDVPNCADIYLEKIRLRRWGRAGNRRLPWDPITGRYYDKIQEMTDQEGLDV